MISRFEDNRATWDRLRTMAYEDLPSCGDQMARGVRCPTFTAMPSDRRAEYDSVAKELGVSLDQVGFRLMPFRLIADPPGPTRDECLEIVVRDAGVPIALRRKAFMNCRSGVLAYKLVPDLDEYVRTHERKDQGDAFRSIGSNWFLYFCPM